MRIKKLLLIGILVFTFCMMLAACGQKSEDGDVSVQEQTTQQDVDQTTGGQEGSEEITTTVPEATSTTPANQVLPSPEVSACETEQGYVELTWSAVPGAESYEILRYGEEEKDWLNLEKTEKNTYTDKETGQGSTQYYRVKAVGNKDGQTIESEYAEALVELKGQTKATAQSQSQVKATAAPKTEKKPKALIVDYETNSSKRMKKYLKKAGFKVTMVESMDDFDVKDYDTLVIPGGHNITPSIYGAERDEHTYGTDENIDKLQIAAVKAFAEKKKPILGVCRGCQLVNVAFGGTINQHIPGWHKKNRTVKIDKDSWLYPRLGTSESVYHYHHQCVEELGEGLVATMWDKKDEHIEGFEHESLPVYGIQWHPDSMGDRGVDIFIYYKELILSLKTQK